MSSNVDKIGVGTNSPDEKAAKLAFDDNGASDSPSYIKKDDADVEAEEEAPVRLVTVCGEKVPSNHIFITKAEIPDSLAHLTTEELFKFASKTRRRVDLRILIMLCWVYICNHLDRTNIAAARLGGLEEDLNLTHQQYQSAISILFAAYTVFQVPSNILLNRLGKPATFITVMMTLWGIVSTACGAVHSYAGLLVARFLVGALESGFFVCSLYYLSCWYTKRELAKRNSILFSGSLMSGALAGLLSAAIINYMDKVANIEAWRWCFILEGLLTVVTVPLCYYVLPNNPSNTKFLSQMEKDMVIWKVKMDVGEEDSDEAVLKERNNYKVALLLAVRDLKIWLVALTVSFLVAASHVQNFFPSVVEMLGYERIKTLWLTAPPFFIAMFATFCWTYHSDKTQERFWHALAPVPITIVTFIIPMVTQAIAPRYIAMCLMLASIYCSYLIVISWMSLIVPRPPLKRAVALAMMNTVANTMHVWNAFLYKGPRFILAMSFNIGFMVLAVASACMIRLRLVQLNKRIAAGKMDWKKEFGNSNVKVTKEFRYTI